MEDFMKLMNWGLLEHHHVITYAEIHELQRILPLDPGAAISKMRKITENLIKTHYDAYKTPGNVPLAQMIKELDELKVYPRPIKVYLDTIRILGNIGVHEGGLTAQDVNVILPMFLHTSRWLITHSLELLVQKLKAKK